MGERLLCSASVRQHASAEWRVETGEEIREEMRRGTKPRNDTLGPVHHSIYELLLQAILVKRRR
jgi:hypothetical protein